MSRIAFMFVALFITLFVAGQQAKAEDLPVLPVAVSIVQQGCVNGSVPVPPGKIIAWRPANCTAADGLIEIRNYTPSCIVPFISGIPSVKVIEAKGMDLAAIGFYRPDGRFISCVPPAQQSPTGGDQKPTVMWMFLPSSTAIISGDGYRVQRDWHITEVTQDVASGVYVKALNGNIGGVTKTAELAYSCRAVTLNTVSPEMWSRDHLPLFEYHGMNCSN